MRISTSQIYDLGGSAVQTHQSGLYKLQQQISSGKRLSSPADDPLAAARVLEISQSKSVSEQLGVNADYATSALNAQENALGSISELLAEVRSLGVYAGNPSLNINDKQVLAVSLRSKYYELLGLANTQDNGKYLFSGFQGETQPFSETTPGLVAYNGDQGQRLIQVTPSRQVPVSSAGVEVFQRIKNGDGTVFASADPNVTGTTNVGTGIATPAALLDATLWKTAGNTGDYRVVFAQDTSAAPGPAVTTYDIVTNVATVVNGVPYAAGDSLLTGVASVEVASVTGGPRYPRTYTAGSTISLKAVAGTVNAPFVTNPDTAWDLGVEFSVSGQPSGTNTVGLGGTPDEFSIKSSVNNQDIFSTIYKLVDALEGGGPTAVANSVMTMLQDLNLAEESVLTAITTVGTVANEVDSHKSANEDLVLQYKTDISHLEDLDYATAITDLTLRQSVLEASQKTFLAVQGLSLFNFI